MFLHFDLVTKRYDGARAVGDLTFDVHEGELVAIVGPSGCGKTTTLRLLAGFDQPDEGDIRLAGESLLRIPPERRGVGIVFQHFALFPHMSVWQNVAYGLKYAGRRMHGWTGTNGSAAWRADADARVAELLQRVDLVGYEKRRPAQLSAGQQQRVAIARALAPRPRVLLLDEPLSALDAQLRQHLRLEIRELQRQLGLTVLYVTHDQEEALAISDRVIVMNEGRIEQIGTPWEVYDAPQTTFVATFVGRTNQWPGKVVDVGEQGLAVDVVGLAAPLAVPKECVSSSGYHPSVGDRCVLMVREERVKVEAAGADGADGQREGPGYAGQSAAFGTLVRMRGQLYEAELLGGSTRLVVTSEAGRYSALVAGKGLPTHRVAIGEPVDLVFDAVDARILPG